MADPVLGPQFTISRSTIRAWLRRYERSGKKLESLFPKQRAAAGVGRSIDPEIQLALVNLRGELAQASLSVVLQVTRRRNLLPPGFAALRQSIYRLFRRHGLHRQRPAAQDRRRFEAELPNDLWQADCMHGPRVVVAGKLRKTFLFACLDDHSRLITGARFYLREDIDCFQDCLLRALETRGLPRKLYFDNGYWAMEHPGFGSRSDLGRIRAEGVAGPRLPACLRPLGEDQGVVRRGQRAVQETTNKVLAAAPGHSHCTQVGMDYLAEHSRHSRGS